jgi:hypothetical protein
MRPAKTEFLSELMEKRNEMMRNRKDEYIEIPPQENPSQENKISESIRRLNRTLERYFENEQPQKIKRHLGNYVLFLVSISGLLVLNDYIIITYFV